MINCVEGIREIDTWDRYVTLTRVILLNKRNYLQESWTSKGLKSDTNNRPAFQASKQ